MVERDGIELTSLTRVAEEAGYAPVTVYAYFPSKTDLLTSIFADDLASLAREMRDSFPFLESVAEVAHEEPTGEPQPEMESAANEDTRGESAEIVPLNPAEHFLVQKPRADQGPSRTERIRAALRKNQPEEQATEGEAPRVDAWLERRLRVFERTLADIETRLAESERSSQRAVLLAHDSAASLERNVSAFQKRDGDEQSALMQRISELEKRQRDTASDLRSGVKDVEGRLDRLESAALGSAKASIYLPPQEETLPQESLVDESKPAEDSPEDSTPAAEETQPTPEANETYLTAARNAAKAAATLSRIEEDEHSGSLTQRTKMLLIAGVALLAMIAGAVFVLHTLPAKPQAMQFAAISPAMADVGTGTTRIHLSPAAVTSRVAALATRGNVKAEVLTGLNYLNGEGVAKSDVQAAIWLGRAANAGDAVAEYWLGTLYQAGRGVNNDQASAIHWLESAAMQGNRKAMHSLAMAYATGSGVTRDYAEAARWFSRAADLGLVNSEFNLAVLYERGDGLPQSLLDAYKWYAIAAAQGDSEAQSRVDALATQLSPDDLAAAKQSVATFKPQPLNTNSNLVPRASDLSNG